VKIENLQSFSAAAQRFTRLVATMTAPSAADSDREAAAKINATIAAWRARAVLAASMIALGQKLRGRASSVDCVAGIPNPQRGHGGAISAVDSVTPVSGTTPDELDRLRADLDSYRVAVQTVCAACPAHDDQTTALLDAITPGGVYRPGRRALVNAHLAQAELRYWQRRATTAHDGTAPREQPVFAVADAACGRAVITPPVGAQRVAPSRVPKWNTLQNWFPGATSRTADPDQASALKAALYRKVWARINDGAHPAYAAPSDVWSGNRDAMTRGLRILRRDRHDADAMRAFRVLFRRHRRVSGRSARNHSGPVFAAVGPLEVWRIISSVTIYRMPAVTQSGQVAPAWVYCWGNVAGVDSDVYHARRDESPDAVAERLDRRLADARRHAADERAASLPKRQQIANTLRAARRVEELAVSDSYAVGNCEPGTTAFVRALGLTGNAAAGREVATAWRRAGYLELSRFSSVVRAASPTAV
jgi:hypothetical protein